MSGFEICWLQSGYSSFSSRIITKLKFCFSGKKINIYPLLFCFPLDNIVSFPAPAALCALVLMSQRMKEKKTEDKIQLLVKHSSGGDGGQREGENEGER